MERGEPCGNVIKRDMGSHIWFTAPHRAVKWISRTRYGVITDDVSDYINLLVRIAHIIAYTKVIQKFSD
jgi:hypothetical protein